MGGHLEIIIFVFVLWGTHISGNQETPYGDQIIIQTQEPPTLCQRFPRQCQMVTSKGLATKAHFRCCASHCTLDRPTGQICGCFVDGLCYLSMCWHGWDYLDAKTKYMINLWVVLAENRSIAWVVWLKINPYWLTFFHSHIFTVNPNASGVFCNTC